MCSHRVKASIGTDVPRKYALQTTNEVSFLLEDKLLNILL